MSASHRNNRTELAHTPAGTGMLTVSLHHRLRHFRLNIEFEVPLGLIVLFGPSGAGKSLTLRALAGLLHPERGQIIVDGHVLFESTKHINLPPQQRRVGYVPQHYALFPHLTVAENIAFGLPKAPVWSRWRKRPAMVRTAELLSALELEGLEQRYPRTLSGGQQQRVALARALAAEPYLLLLDEPFNALDATVRERLREALQQFQRRFALPILLVTHDRLEAQQLADTLIVIQNGRVMQVGTGEMVFRAPRTADLARLVGQPNHFTGHLATPTRDHAGVPSVALRLDRLNTTELQEAGAPPVPKDTPGNGWLPLPANQLITNEPSTQHTAITGCILPDEITVQSLPATPLASAWTSHGAARWIATLLDSQLHDHAIRLLVRPQWKESTVTGLPSLTGTLEIYLSRQQWREVAVAPGEQLLLEIGPQAVHWFESTLDED